MGSGLKRVQKTARGGQPARLPLPTGEKNLYSVRVGQLSHYSQVLLLPLGVPPTLARPTQSLSQSCGVWRVLTTTDVGNLTQGQGVLGGGGDKCDPETTVNSDRLLSHTAHFFVAMRCKQNHGTIAPTGNQQPNLTGPIHCSRPENHRFGFQMWVEEGGCLRRSLGSLCGDCVEWVFTMDLRDWFRLTPPHFTHSTTKPAAPLRTSQIGGCSCSHRVPVSQAQQQNVGRQICLEEFCCSFFVLHVTQAHLIIDREEQAKGMCTTKQSRGKSVFRGGNGRGC